MTHNMVLNKDEVFRNIRGNRVREKDFPTTCGIQAVMSLNHSSMENENSSGYLLKTMFMTHNMVLNKDEELRNLRDNR